MDRFIAFIVPISIVDKFQAVQVHGQDINAVLFLLVHFYIRVKADAVQGSGQDIHLKIFDMYIEIVEGHVHSDHADQDAPQREGHLHKGAQQA